MRTFYMVDISAGKECSKRIDRKLLLYTITIAENLKQA